MKSQNATTNTRSSPLTEMNLRLHNEGQTQQLTATVDRFDRAHRLGQKAGRVVVNDQVDPGHAKSTPVDLNVVMQEWLLDRDDALGLWLGGSLSSSNVNQEKKA